MNRTARVVAGVALGLGLCQGSFAAEAPAAPATRPVEGAATRPSDLLTLATERVVIFKDNYGLVAKTGKAVADAEGRVYTTEVPDSAVLGTFWALGEGDKLLGMNAVWDEKKEKVKKETDCLTMPELLRANVGKSVTLGLGDRRNVVGTIVDVLEVPVDERATPEMAAAILGRHVPFIATGAGPGEQSVVRREIVARGGDFVVIDESGGGRMVMPVGHVQTITGKDVVSRMVREEEVVTRSKRLAFEFGKGMAGKAVNLRVFYFTPGLRWIPTYRVSGELKDKAGIALQGEILNEVEDIGNAAVDLVVGVPHFRFKQTPSPLTLEMAMRNALVSANYIGRNNDIGNQLMNNSFEQRAGEWQGRRGAGADPAAAAALAPELSGAAGEQDLFVYSLKEFTLKRGGRATVPLWSNEIPLQHLYTLDVKMTRTRRGGGLVNGEAVDAGQSPLRMRKNQVWHQLELANTSSVPWTTGAALTMRNHLPIAQDLITYTPPGTSALLPLTVAVDIIGTSEEQETGRVNAAARFHDADYAQVTKKGTLKLTNHRKEKATARVTLSTGGKVTTVSDEGKVVINDFRGEDWQESGYHSVNNHSDVTWDLTLEPGESKVVTYTVTFYVR